MGLSFFLFSRTNQTGRMQGKIGLLQFLCAWLSRCSAAVEAFISLRSANHQSVGGGGTTPSKNNGSGSSGAGAALSHLIANVLAGEGEETDIVSCLSSLIIGICVCYNNGAVKDYDRYIILERENDLAVKVVTWHLSGVVAIVGLSRCLV